MGGQPFNKQQKLIALIILILGILSWTFGFSALMIQGDSHIDMIDGKCIYPTNVAPILGIIGAVMFLITQIPVTVAVAYMIFGPRPPTVPRINPKKYHEVRAIFFVGLCWLISAIVMIGAIGNQRLYLWLINKRCNETYGVVLWFISIGLLLDDSSYIAACHYKNDASNPQVAPV